LLLIGGGHAQVHVLQRLAAEPPGNLAVTLVSRESRTPYSGMLPGLVAGHYESADLHIDLRPLCAEAGVRFVEDSIQSLDLQRRIAFGSGGATFNFDWLSLNCGSAPGLDRIPGAQTFGIAVKPIGQFLPHWLALRERVLAVRDKSFHMLVVGGGAGGVELAFALQYRLGRVGGARHFRVTLISGADSLLPDYPRAAGRRVARLLSERGIRLRLDTRISSAAPGALSTAAGEVITGDDVLWVTDAGAPAWPGAAGLAVDSRGFVQVDRNLQSISSPGVFAAGDIASLAGGSLPKAGVFAVRQGPVLADNLLRAARGEGLRSYRPQRRYLSLIATGNRYAIAVRGPFVAAGGWVWRWKDWIDRRFVDRFRPSQ
jgi:selenide,water dikinase